MNDETSKEIDGIKLGSYQQEIDLISELKNILSDSDLNTLNFSKGGVKIKLSKEKQIIQQSNIPHVQGSGASVSLASNNESTKPLNIEKSEFSENLKTVFSPMVGTAYLAPSPDAKNFVNIGQQVKEGDTLLIIEAMKTMNHVNSSVTGVIQEILVGNDHPVEYDQPLIKIKVT